MAVVVVRRRGLRSRVVVVSVVVRVVVRMIVRMVMRVAMRSHVSASGLTDMSALVGRVQGYFKCWISFRVAWPLWYKTLDFAVGSAANTTSFPSSFVSYRQSP
jgi:hypothetical protein